MPAVTELPTHIQDIRRLRVEAGLNQLELDDRVGVADGYTAKIESGARNPALSMIGFYATALTAEVRVMSKQSDQTIPAFEGGNDLARAKSFSRDKGYRIEKEIVDKLMSIDVSAERVIASGAFGRFDSNLEHDLRVCGLTGEVKARANGAGFITLEQWKGTAEILFLRRDRAEPMVVLDWETFSKIIKAYQEVHQCPMPAPAPVSKKADPQSPSATPSPQAPAEALASHPRLAPPRRSKRSSGI